MALVNPGCTLEQPWEYCEIIHITTTTRIPIELSWGVFKVLLILICLYSCEAIVWGLDLEQDNLNSNPGFATFVKLNLCGTHITFSNNCLISDIGCWCCCCSVAQLCVTLWPQGLQHSMPACPSPSPWVCPSSLSLHQWCRPAISSSDALFFCYLSFLMSGIFPISCLFTSGDQNTGTSASVLPVYIQGWSPLRFTGLISLPPKRLSGIFSSTTVWKHQFFGVLPSLQSSSHKHTWPLGSP